MTCQPERSLRFELRGIKKSFEKWLAEHRIGQPFVPNIRAGQIESMAGYPPNFSGRDDTVRRARGLRVWSPEDPIGLSEKSRPFILGDSPSYYTSEAADK